MWSSNTHTERNSTNTSRTGTFLLCTRRWMGVLSEPEERGEEAPPRTLVRTPWGSRAPGYRRRACRRCKNDRSGTVLMHWCPDVRRRERNTVESESYFKLIVTDGVSQSGHQCISTTRAAQALFSARSTSHAVMSRILPLWTLFFFPLRRTWLHCDRRCIFGSTRCPRRKLET
jgi:hypothetical protein